MTKLEELNQRKLSLISQMRTLSNKDSLDATEDATYERFEQELETVEKTIAREIKLDSIESVLNQPVDVPTIETPNDDTRTAAPDDKKRYQDAFEEMLRSNPTTRPISQETRVVLNTGTGSEGGYLVPEDYLTTVINKLLDMNVMRQNSTVLRTASTTNIPLGDARPTFSEILENGTYPQTDASFGQAVLGAKKIGGIIKASDELIQDSFIDLQSYLTNLIAEGIANVEENRFTVGNGTTQAQGIITASDLGKTTVATAGVSTDEVIDLIYSVKAIYRKNGKLMMNSSTEKAVRQIKDTQGQYLWQPSLQVGVPNTFDGYPIVINEEMASLGTGNKFMGFGDMKYYTIGDRGGLELKVLPELYAENGQIGWRASKRADGVLTQSETFKHMINA